MATESIKEHGPLNFRCNVACAVAHLTWTLSPCKGYRSREDEISLFNMVSLISFPHYSISSQARARSALSLLQFKQAVVSDPLHLQTLLFIYAPGAPGNYLPSSLPSAPIMPGSALRLLNQGRAQGLFTPSTSQHQGLVYPPPPGVVYTSSPAPVVPGVSPTPPMHSLKRTRSEMEAGSTGIPDTIQSLITAQGSVDQLI